MAEEYEYSFKVKDIKPYIDYCINNDYEKTGESSQTRILYRNINKTMARMTTKENNGKKKTVLDFKDDNESSEVLKISRETIPLVINDENKEAIDSILDMLEYRKDKALIRNRFVYEKNNVTFEIDEYTSPEIMYVVAVEGKKSEVDKFYKEIELFNRA